MSYRIERKESVTQAVRRVAREQIDRAIAEIEDRQLDRHEAVHQVRKRCKKLRGLVRLVRPQMEETYRRENECFRDAAREISFVRDAQSMLECFDELLERYARELDPESFAPIREWLLERRKQVTQDEQRLEAGLARMLVALREARDRIPDWQVAGGEEADEFAAVGGGLRKTYKRGRKARAAAFAASTDEQFHEWRKRVKYHWYHARLLQRIWRPVMDCFADAAHELSDILGDDHDLAILRSTLAEHAGNLPAANLPGLAALIGQRRTELQLSARRLGDRLYAEKPGQVTRRLGCYWSAWRRPMKASVGTSRA